MTTYRECVKCVMDTSDPEISFDSAGVCNHCLGFQKSTSFRVFSEEEEKSNLERLSKIVRASGKGKKYDCIIGLSGGVDSSYVAYLSKVMGLRPLLVHLDNGWNSEFAVKNIENIVNFLNSDLHTHVIDWNEFRELQLSYFRAGVVDIEALTDHAILATIYKLAKKHKVKYILSGTNNSTEAILPSSWVHPKTDLSNIEDIFGKYSKTSLKTFPKASIFKINVYYKKILGIERLEVLDYVNYVKSKAIVTIQREMGWINYGRKHGESTFTKFYQNYILPEKFGIDKRRAHLSTLICTGQITKEEAVKQLSEPLYDPSELKKDKDFVLKKLNMTNTEFESYLKASPRSHYHFKSDIVTIRKIRNVLRLLGVKK